MGGIGLGAIDRDITARQIARTLNIMDCLVMGPLHHHLRKITAAGGDWLRIVTSGPEVPYPKPQANQLFRHPRAKTPAPINTLPPVRLTARWTRGFFSFSRAFDASQP